MLIGVSCLDGSLGGFIFAYPITESLWRSHRTKKLKELERLGAEIDLEDKIKKLLA